jgi:two-component system LytT family response regulator
MTRAIILENEPSAMETFVQMLDQYCPTVKLVGKAYNNVEAKERIDTNLPDLVFMDIELDTGNSLELLSHYDNPSFEIIFTTAHAEYALQAIRASCLDFLIKPIDHRELQKAVVKHEQKLSYHSLAQRLQSMIHNLSSKHLSKLTIPTVNGFEFFDTNDILMCKAEGSYTNIHLNNNAQCLTSKPIGELETLLATSFFRCHKSYLINLKHIVKFNRSNSQITLTGNITADLANRKQAEFLNLIR